MTSNVKGCQQIFLGLHDFLCLRCIGRARASTMRRLILLISVGWVPPSLHPSGACLGLGSSVLYQPRNTALGALPSIRADSSQKESIEVASASTGCQAWSESARPSKTTWPAGISACRLRPWSPGTRASDGASAPEASRAASCLCWMNRSTQSACNVSPVNSAMGAFQPQLQMSADLR
jgi:hypothetical protein